VTPDVIPLDEEVWRKWLLKGKLRKQQRDRRSKRIAGFIVASAAIAFGVIRLLGR